MSNPLDGMDPVTACRTFQQMLDDYWRAALEEFTGTMEDGAKRAADELHRVLEEADMPRSAKDLYGAAMFIAVNSAMGLSLIDFVGKQATQHKRN